MVPARTTPVRETSARTPSVRGAGLALLALAALPAWLPGPAAAQSPSKSYLFQERQLRGACRPPLKLAAGACVRRCPAGYQDMGATCRQRSMQR